MALWHAQRHSNPLENSARPIGKQQHNSWFLENYNAHPLNEALVSQIDSLFDDIEVRIYMGTWCEDSQREVPGFFKIIDALEANDQIQSDSWTKRG